MAADRPRRRILPLLVLCNACRCTLAANATGRGVDELATLFVPPLPSLASMFSVALQRTGATALELGCGEGNALLQLQLRYRNTRGTCINSIAYGKSCVRSNSGRCASGVVTGDNPQGGLRLAATQMGLPDGEPLPTIIYGDYTQQRLLDDPSMSFDVVYSQHALNTGKINHPATEFIPIAIEVLQRLRPCGYAVLHLFPCCAGRKQPQLKYGNVAVWDRAINAAHELSQRTRTTPQATILDAKVAMLPTGDQKVQLVLSRVPAYNPRDAPPMPAAFVLLAHKPSHKQRRRGSCPMGTLGLLDALSSSMAGPKQAVGEIVLTNTSQVQFNTRGRPNTATVSQEYLSALHSWLNPPNQHHAPFESTRRASRRAVASTPSSSGTTARNGPTSSRPMAHAHAWRQGSLAFTEPQAQGGNPKAALSHAIAMYGEQDFPLYCSTADEKRRGPWCADPWQATLTKRWHQSNKVLRNCKATSDKLAIPFLNTSRTLLGCQLVPVACSLCFVLVDTRFKVAILDAASMRASTANTLIALVACAALGMWLAGRCATPSEPSSSDASKSCCTSNMLFSRPACYWTRGPPCLHPVATLKLTVFLLLAVDLVGLTAPELNILATPELIARDGRHPKQGRSKLSGIIPPLTQWAMPDLSFETAAAHSAWLRKVRTTLFVAWGLFLALPPRFRICLTALYVLGAGSYVCLGSLGLPYNLAHSTQSSMLFVTLASFTVPDLATNPRSGTWLLQMILRAVVSPFYLCSGISKLRYIGVRRQVSGAWLIEDVGTFGSLGMFVRAAVPTINHLVFHMPGGLILMGVGNLVFEFLMPFLILLSVPGSMCEFLFRMGLSVMAFGFHLAIFLMMGPNFIRHSVLVLMANDPLSFFSRRWQGGHLAWTDAEGDQRAAQQSVGLLDAIRGAVTTAVVVAWLAVQIDSDSLHMRGLVSARMKYDSYWPVPEMSMFAQPSEQVSFILTRVLSTFTLVAFCYRVWG